MTQHSDSFPKIVTVTEQDKHPPGATPEQVRKLDQTNPGLAKLLYEMGVVTSPRSIGGPEDL